LARAILVAHAGLYRHQSRCRLCVEFNIYVVHRGHPYLKKMSARAARTAKLDTAIVAFARYLAHRHIPSIGGVGRRRLTIGIIDS